MKRAQRPFINAKEVAAQVGGISFKTVLNGNGPFGALTKHYIGSQVVFDANEVDALIRQVREDAERSRARTQKRLEPMRRHLRAVGGS